MDELRPDLSRSKAGDRPGGARGPGEGLGNATRRADSFRVRPRARTVPPAGPRASPCPGEEFCPLFPDPYAVGNATEEVDVRLDALSVELLSRLNGPREEVGEERPHNDAGQREEDLGHVEEPVYIGPGRAVDPWSLNLCTCRWEVGRHHPLNHGDPRDQVRAEVVAEFRAVQDFRDRMTDPTLPQGDQVPGR